jgi:type IV pilus assembly protein PilM
MRHSRKYRTIGARDERGGFFELHKFITRLRPPQETLGIEITDYSIKLVQIIKTHKQEIVVQKCLIEKLPKQVVADGRIKDPAQVILLLKNMLAKLEIKTKKVHLVLPSELIMVRFLKLPDIADKDLRKLVDFQMKHNIHLPFDAPVYDFTKLNGNKEISQTIAKTKKKTKANVIKQVEGGRAEAAAALSDLDQLFADHVEQNLEDIALLQCDVMLVAAPQELITEYEEVFAAASLLPLSMEFKALSLFRVMEHSHNVDTRNTVLVIDINDHLSDLSIFHNRQLKITRSIPIDFTLVGSSTKTTIEQELFYSFIDQDTDFINICNDLGFELERLINFYRYTLNNREHEFTQILVSGDVPRLEELAKIIAERLHLDIILMNSDQIKSPIPGFDQLFPAIAVPIGLALRGNKR